MCLPSLRRICTSNCVFNADETHLKIETNNGCTLEMRGEDVVKVDDVVSSNECMTMMVLLSGGTNAVLCPPMMISQNKIIIPNQMSC